MARFGKGNKMGARFGKDIDPKEAQLKGAKSRTLAKSLKEAYLRELNSKVEDNKGNTISGFTAVARAMMREATRGNHKAAHEMAHIIGEDVQVVQIDNSIPIQIVDDGLGE